MIFGVAAPAVRVDDAIKPNQPMNRIFPFVLFALICAPLSRALAADAVDAVTVKDDKVYAIRGDKKDQDVLAANLSFPDKVGITTNGIFTVADGKERKLEEGQVLRRDGWLLNANGSVQPVIDHLAMKEGQAYLVRDGQSAPLTKPLAFPNGMSVNPDGYGSNLPGGRSRLIDGQLFRLNGSILQGKDTATLKNGHVVVQRDGSMVPLAPVTVMGMNDGTRVYGDGTIQKHDGSTFKLREGQTILIDGAFYGH